jgi:hypothetical protein
MSSLPSSSSKLVATALQEQGYVLFNKISVQKSDSATPEECGAHALAFGYEKSGKVCDVFVVSALRNNNIEGQASTGEFLMEDDGDNGDNAQRDSCKQDNSSLVVEIKNAFQKESMEDNFTEDSNGFKVEPCVFGACKLMCVLAALKNLKTASAEALQSEAEVVQSLEEKIVAGVLNVVKQQKDKGIMEVEQDPIVQLVQDGSMKNPYWDPSMLITPLYSKLCGLIWFLEKIVDLVHLSMPVIAKDIGRKLPGHMLKVFFDENLRVAEMAVALSRTYRMTYCFPQNVLFLKTEKSEEVSPDDKTWAYCIGEKVPRGPLGYFHPADLSIEKVKNITEHMVSLETPMKLGRANAISRKIFKFMIVYGDLDTDMHDIGKVSNLLDAKELEGLNFLKDIGWVDWFNRTFYAGSGTILYPKLSASLSIEEKAVLKDFADNKATLMDILAEFEPMHVMKCWSAPGLVFRCWP